MSEGQQEQLNVVFTETGLPSRLLSVCRAASGPPERHECRQRRVRQGFAT